MHENLYWGVNVSVPLGKAPEVDGNSLMLHNATDQLGSQEEQN